MQINTSKIKSNYETNQSYISKKKNKQPYPCLNQLTKKQLLNETDSDLRYANKEKEDKTFL